MQAMTVRPGKGYLRKTRLIFTLISLLITVFGLLLGLLVGIDEGAQVAANVFTGFLIPAVLFWIISMLLAGPYYRSLSYEIQDDEVIVRVGIVTKSVKHVPYRTVTNITINRGILDRAFFNLGTLNIQTAGMSGTGGAEESLVGLTNVQEIYDLVVDQLRLFRGGMSPTAAEVETTAPTGDKALLGEILEELKAIRENTQR